MYQTSHRRAAAGSQYALVVGLIGVIALAAIGSAGGSLKTLLSKVNNSIGGAENTTASTVPPPPPPSPQAPTAINLSPSLINENQSSGSAVGTLSATDADSASHVFTLVSGTGSTDNASFAIVGTTLNSAAIFDYEGKNSYAIRVRATDPGGLFYEQPLTVSIGDVLENALVPGNTTLIVTRNNVQVRCSQWTGRSCDLPEYNFGSSSYFNGDPQKSTWVRPYIYNNGPNTLIAGCNAFCSFATGSPGYDACAADPTGYTGHNWRLTAVDTSYAGSVTVTAPSGASFNAYIQNTNNQYFNRLTCTSW